jgi:hypothetical protein
MQLGDEHNGRYALPCGQCGTLTWHHLRHQAPIRCRECLVTKHGIPRDAWRERVDVVPRGRSWPSERGQAEVIAEPIVPTHRILTPCRLATDDELPASARSLIELATEYQRKPVATYALAETIKTGALVRSVVVRFAAFQRYITPNASYVNGMFQRAWWPRAEDGMVARVGHDELHSLIAGRVYVPPVINKLDCPRCDRPDVRWTVAGAPYAHNRPDSKERCDANAS